MTAASVGSSCSYAQAAHRQLSDGQVNVGRCCMLGWGVPRAPQVAVGWYQRAAAQGNAAGLHNLALCYQGGVGVCADEVHALALLSTAAEQGYAPAMYSLGECHHRGRGGLSASAVTASQWYERAAMAQSAAAALALGQVRTQPMLERAAVSLLELKCDGLISASPQVAGSGV